MKKLDDNTLEKYFDGELSSQEMIRVENQVKKDAAAGRRLEQNKKLSDFIQIMHEETTKGIAFDGLSNRVLAASKASEPPRLMERIRVWLSEFFEHRRVIWIPAAAATATALTLLFVPFAPVPPSNGTALNQGITLHSASSTIQTGSTIATVDFGGAKGTTYNLKTDFGSTVGVVWIEETP